MAISKTGQVKFISESFVKPKNEIEASDSNQQSSYHHLGPMDLCPLSSDYMQQGMLLRFTPTLHSASDHHHLHHQTSNSDDHDHDHSIESFLEKLRDSLSICLVHFYPLAGRLATKKFPDDHASLIFVDCTKGPGARILHASLDMSASDLLSPTGHVSPAVRSLFDLGEMKVNHDGHTHPLLSIQVTELLDGIFMGFTMNHSVADGTSFLHFVSALSEVFLTRSDTMFKKPILKPFFPNGHGPTLKLRYLDPEEFVTRLDPGPLRERIFHFSPASMAALKAKAKANEETGVLDISSFQALSALLWRSITRARNSKPDEETNCTFAINSRPRLEPPFSEDYFGNFVSGAQISSTVGELLGHDLGWAAMMVHKRLAAQDDKAVRRFVEMCVKASFVAKPSSKPNQVLIGWSTKFDMYAPEFGFGRPLAVLSGYGNIFDGKVTANQGREGEGSVDLQIGLRPETMIALESDEELMSYVSY